MKPRMAGSTLLLLLALAACQDAGITTAPEPGSGTARKAGKPTSGVTVTDLSLSSGQADSRAEDIDDQGRIAGWRGPWSGPNRAFLWTPTTPRGSVGTLVDLGDLGGGAAEVWGMNQSGQIVGSSITAGGAMRAFLWEGGSMHELPASGTAASDLAFGVNDAATRLVVGGNQAIEIALVWTVSGSGSGFQTSGPVLLPGISGPGGFAYAVNNAGVAVGYGWAAGMNQPARWTNTGAGWTLTVLPLPPNAVGGIARDVNSAGTIVGEVAMAGTGCAQAVVWTAAVSLLPPLAVGSCSAANAVNDAGQIAGISSVRGADHAVLWQPLLAGGYAVTDLGALSGSSATVRAINEPDVGAQSGVEVVGFSRDRKGAFLATLWTLK
jgi:probable HAF family extracellular repeat protein